MTYGSYAPYVLLAVAACCLAYTGAARRLRARGDRWPPRRDAVCWSAGAVLAVAALPWPGGEPFTAHTAAHLATGMLAPLLLALARPVTLTLRTLPVPARRRLLACLRSRPAALLTWPPVAAAVNAAGLWALYRTPLLAHTHHHPWLQAAVHLHLLLSGFLLAFAVLALEPVRHRSGHLLRGAALIGAAAAHDVLAKSLYATGPPGTVFAPHDLHAGAQLMYYGGDLTGVALAALLALGWYRDGGRALARTARRTAYPRP
ncbi:cytochrome c oxidase assembly protein [Streptomyces monticola]|uniref:Cytochrome c oxidase assembly protein n=1 Tax=Streptomyces monticola TaxID=2666263 RepID=A0ABW2JW08_9ACTN